MFSIAQVASRSTRTYHPRPMICLPARLFAQSSMRSVASDAPTVLFDRRMQSARPNHSRLVLAQTQSFTTLVSKRDDPSETGDNQSILQANEQLVAENETLKKKLIELEATIAKSEKGLLATVKKFGPSFLVYWGCLYVGSATSLFAAFDTGLINSAHAIDFIMSLGLDKLVDPEQLNPTHGNLALAVVVNEALEVVRLPLAVATLPTVKKAFSSKPPVESL